MSSLDTKGSLERNILSLIKLLSKVPAFVMVTEWLPIALCRYVRSNQYINDFGVKLPL